MRSLQRYYNFILIDPYCPISVHEPREIVIVIRNFSLCKSILRNILYKNSPFLSIEEHVKAKILVVTATHQHEAIRVSLVTQIRNTTIFWQKNHEKQTYERFAEREI